MNLWKRILPAAGLLLLVCAGAAPAALADYGEVVKETYATTERVGQVTLNEHTSYRTDYYGNIIHLESADKTVAVASADSEGCVLITAVGAGSTTVTFWYKYGYYDADDDWTRVTVPVQVSGKSGGLAANASSSEEEGLYFPLTSVTLEAGSEKTLEGILLNGSEIAASNLLWLTTADSVLSVGRDTGAITARQAGEGLLYALTPDGRYVNCLLITVE